MKKLVSLLAVFIVLAFPLMSSAEPEILPFTFDLDGNSVTMTSAKAYKAVHTFLGEESEDVILIVIDFDVSDLPDNLLKTFFEKVDIPFSAVNNPDENDFRKNDVVSVVWLTNHLAQFVIEHPKETLSSNDYLISLSCEGENPVAYITDSKGTRSETSFSSYVISVTFDDAEDFVSMGSDLCQLLMEDYHYFRR